MGESLEVPTDRLCEVRHEQCGLERVGSSDPGHKCYDFIWRVKKLVLLRDGWNFDIVPVCITLLTRGEFGVREKTF